MHGFAVLQCSPGKGIVVFSCRVISAASGKLFWVMCDMRMALGELCIPLPRRCPCSHGCRCSHLNLKLWEPAKCRSVTLLYRPSAVVLSDPRFVGRCGLRVDVRCGEYVYCIEWRAKLLCGGIPVQVCKWIPLCCGGSP